MLKAYDVLIVDDSRSLRMVIRKLLETTNIFFSNVYEAENGKEALDLLEVNKVDFIFSDINMPIMNGVEFLKQMKAKGISIPTIVITTDASKETVIETVKNGAVGYIKKPFTSEKLKEIIDKYLH